MNASINHIDEFEKELLITTDWISIQDEYDTIINRFSKFPLKGFRAGKAPVSAVESSFKNEIKNELISVCTKRFCRKALQDNEMEAASPLEISDILMDKNKQLSFKASFIQMPCFELPDYRHLNLQATDATEKLDEISIKLLECTEILLHASLIQKELKYGETPIDQTTDEDRAAAESRVKLMLILKKIANQDSIEVDDKDIDRRIEVIALENDVTKEQLQEFLLENGGLSRLADSLLAEQVLQYIIEIQEQA